MTVRKFVVSLSKYQIGYLMGMLHDEHRWQGCPCHDKGKSILECQQQHGHIYRRLQKWND